MKKHEIYTPIAFTQTLDGQITTVNGYPAGTYGPLIGDRFRNPDRGPIYLDAIRFQIMTDEAGPVPGPGNYAAKVKLGRNELTREFVPIWLLDKALSNNQDQGPNPTFVWRFQRPLYMPSGAFLSVQLQFQGYNYTGSKFAVRVTALGRALPESFKEPRFVDVPYATARVFTSNPGGANYTDQSYEPDFANSFQVPLDVHRFVGRVAMSNGGGYGEWDVGLGANAYVAQVDFNSATGDQAAATNTLVRGVSYLGSAFIRDETPLDTLFCAPEHAWTVNTVLPPKGFFKFYLREAYSALSAGNSYRPQIAMLGSRKVLLQDAV